MMPRSQLTALAEGLQQQRRRDPRVLDYRTPSPPLPFHARALRLVARGEGLVTFAGGWHGVLLLAGAVAAGVVGSACDCFVLIAIGGLFFRGFVEYFGQNRTSTW